VSPAGDPGSCSQLGGSLRLLAARLRTSSRPLHRALEADDPPRGGAGVVRTRRRAGLVRDGLDAAAAELDRVGTALQAHATDLAEALAASRDVVARAAAAGLEVQGGRLVPRWGVAGLADQRAAADQDAARTTFQAELDSVASLLRTRRSRLAGTVATSREVVARHAEALRR